jgi:hypothetical protein
MKRILLFDFPNYLKLWILPGLFMVMTLITSKSFSQPVACNVADSNALIEFYWDSNGPTWTNSDNWLTGPVQTWYGVVVIGDSTNPLIGRVQAIHLVNNNLSGTISSLVCNLDKLGNFWIMDNNLTGQIPICINQLENLNSMWLLNNHLSGQLPSFKNCPLTTLFLSNNEFEGSISDTLINKPQLWQFLIDGNKFSHVPKADLIVGQWYKFENNRLTFSDIIPYKLGVSPGGFTYAPQDSVLQAIDTTVIVGSDLVLDSWVDTCFANMYKWKKNGVFLTPSPVANSQLNLSNIQFSDSGYYSCDVTNWYAYDLTLHRRLIHVQVVDSIVSAPAIAHPGFAIAYNSSNAYLNIRLIENSGKPVQCGLFDLLGRQVLRLYLGHATPQELHYYLKETGIKKGVYFVRLLFDGKLVVKKVVVG